MRGLLLTICLFLLAKTLVSQDCKNQLNLIVKNSESDSVLEDFDLEIVPLNPEIGYEGGRDLLCNEEYEIVVSSTNFHSKSTIWMQKNREDTLTIHLNPLIFYDDKKTVLRITKPEEEGLTKVERVETSNIPASSTLGEALSSIKGVTILKTGQNVGKPIIHGLHSSRVPTFVNGIRLEDQEWGVEHDPNVDITDYEQIGVIKGAGMLRYTGDGIGGIALLQSRRLNYKNDWQGKTGLDYQTNGRGFGGNLSLGRGFSNKFAFRMHGAFSKVGDQFSPYYILSNTGAQSFAGSVYAGYKYKRNQLLFNYAYLNRELGILRSAHTGSLSDLYRAIEADEPFFQQPFSYDINAPKQQVSHQLAKIEWKSTLSESLSYDLSYAFQRNQRFEFDIRRSTDKASVDLALTTHDFLADFDFHKWRKLHIQNGIAMQYQNNFANPETGVRRLIPDYDRLKAGGYSSVIYNPSRKLKLEAAVRYDFTYISATKFYDISRWQANGYDVKYKEFEDDVFASVGQIRTKPVLDYHNTSGFVGLDYKINKELNILFNYGLSVRAPNPSELFSDGLHHSAASIERGELGLTNESAQKLNLYFSGLYEEAKGFHFELAPYFYNFNDYIYNIPSGAEQTIRGSFPVWTVRQIDAIIGGIDVDFGLKPIEKMDYETKFSYLYGQDKTTNQPLINMPPLRWEQTLKYNLVKSSNTFVGFSTEYVARQNRFPDFNFDILLIENGTIVSKEVDLSTPPASYFLLHANFSHQWKLAENDLEVSLVAKNLLNESYRDYLNRLRYFSDEIGTNINLKINYNF